MHMVNMEGMTEHMLPENQDVTVSETPYINTEPVITAPASTSTISTYTNTHPYPSVSLWATPTCTVSRSQTIVPPKEIEQGPVQMPGKGHPLYFAPQVTEVTAKERPPLYFAPQVTEVTAKERPPPLFCPSGYRSYCQGKATPSILPLRLQKFLPRKGHSSILPLRLQKLLPRKGHPLYFAPQVTEVTAKERPPLYFAPQDTEVTAKERPPPLFCSSGYRSYCQGKATPSILPLRLQKLLPIFRRTAKLFTIQSLHISMSLLF